MRKLAKLVLSTILLVMLTACGISPQVMAEQRMFLHLSLEFVGEYQLPKLTFQETPVQGLSALTYDRQKNRFYVLCDDRSQFAPARFYTLNLSLKQAERGVSIDKVDVATVTFLTNEAGKTYTQGMIDPEGIALSPRGTVFIASEGVASQGIAPFIGEFDLKSGQLKQKLKLPSRYLPNAANNPEQSPRGVQDNLGFEALTLNQSGLMKDDPFRLFTATESALLQDSPPKSPEENARIRLMHYVINPFGEPVFIAESLYLLDAAASDTLLNGLTELTALGREGFFLSLERTLGLSGFGAKIFQVVNANATDTSRISSLQGSLAKIVPLQKKLLLDLSQLNLDLDNLEGMSLGPHLPDGSELLVLLSDDNFKNEQVTQLLLFRLIEN